MLKIHTILFAALFVLGLHQTEKQDMNKSTLPAPPVTIDGPYVLYRNDSILVNYIEKNENTRSVRTDVSPASSKNTLSLQVNTDIPGKTFNVQLKPKLVNEKAEYNGVKKMLVISDIEGNFEAFRKLLQGNHVIDEDFNWTFGKDHLVLVGDFVDRGVMVTEVLWLIYMLEEKAKAAGGYVHYILGNHEIMNMSDDLDYVQERYIEHAALMKQPYMRLFGHDAEIGRWLATKNVFERVGKILFMHGGVSSYMNTMSIPLKELNEMTRPYYTDTTYKYPDPRLEIIYSDYGPFWYRGYYKAPRATPEQIDSTLNIYNANHIVTGHTIIANEVRSLYLGRVYDIDVHHAEGRPEALLIEDGKFWRVNTTGEKLEIAPI